MRNGYDEQPMSKRQRIEAAPNHIILLTVLNPAYPITTDILHRITHSYGNVQRIVIFRKNGVQAMVEYETLDEAKRCKIALHGADIYSGCCTLRIDFAKTDKLNVYRNNDDTYDYTNPNVGLERDIDKDGPPRPALLPSPPPSMAGFPSPRSPGYTAGMSPPHPAPPYTAYPPRDAGFAGVRDTDSPVNRGFNNRNSQPFPPSRNPAGPSPFSSDNGRRISPGGYNDRFAVGPGTDRNDRYGDYDEYEGGYGVRDRAGHNMLVGQQEGCVLMVYNMVPNRMNCEKLFNLFCLYGNVAKIKFLKSKEGSAMVQMGDHMAVTHVVSNLRNLTVFGNPLQLQYSKQAFLTEQAKPQDLPDGTSSFQNFTNSKNNRFVNNDAKNRIQAPCKMLHFFNCPPAVSESELREIFTSSGVEAPIDVKIFQKREEGARVCGGLMQFETQSAAVDAIVTCNHTPITADTSKYPYILKLCFSTTRADKIMRDADMD